MSGDEELSKLKKNGTLPKSGANPMRCGAKTRSDGTCKSPAMKNGRCRLHGGKTPAPGPTHPNYKHGLYSGVMTAEEEDAFDAFGDRGEVDREIDMVRLLLRRALVAAHQLEEVRPGRAPDPALVTMIDRLTGRVGHLAKIRAELIETLGEPGDEVEVGEMVGNRQQVDPELRLPVDQLLKAASWIESVCYELDYPVPTELIAWCRGEKLK